MKVVSVAAPRRGRRLPALRPLALALAGASLFTPLPGLSAPPVLPTGASVAHGQASVVTQGSSMTVTNSNNAILNWQSFSVGQGASVRFDQPSSSSQVLNRVVGSDPSSIFGNLSSNGRVWLLNPHGVLFGPNARVDVAGLVASTLNVTDVDWVARRYALRPFAPSPFGDTAVVNQGELRTTAGGRVVLVGTGAVRNEGVIDASGGHVVLAAGQSVDLADTTTPRVALRVSAPAGEAVNLGRIESGRVDLQAAVVNQHGLVRATTLAGDGGHVELRATQALNLEAGSRTTADGAAGGHVTADAGREGTLLAAGEVSASGSASTGGRIELLGQRVGLLDGARVAATGSAGGGEVYVGGGLQGRDTTLPNAEAVYIGPQAAVDASATEAGDGGRIIVWSDRATRAYGSFSARGGPAGGDGGFIETSGGWLDARPASIDVTAPIGRAGEWLLDPNDLRIVQDNGENSDFNISSGPDFLTTGDAAVVLTSTIEAALNAGNNVSLTTASGPPNSEPGDIFMEDATISVAPPTPVTLTLNAQRHIEISRSTIEGGTVEAPLNISLRSGGSGAGAILIEQSIINTPGGKIDLGGATVPAWLDTGADEQAGWAIGTSERPVAVDIMESRILAPGGRIAARGFVSTGANDTLPGALIGVRIEQGGDPDTIPVTRVAADDIELTGIVVSGADRSRFGIYLDTVEVLASRDLSIYGHVDSEVFRSNRPVVGVLSLNNIISAGGPNNNGGAFIYGRVDEKQDFAGGLLVARYGLIDSSIISMQGDQARHHLLGETVGQGGVAAEFTGDYTVANSGNIMFEGKGGGLAFGGILEDEAVIIRMISARDVQIRSAGGLVTFWEIYNDDVARPGTIIEGVWENFGIQGGTIEVYGLSINYRALSGYSGGGNISVEGGTINTSVYGAQVSTAGLIFLGGDYISLGDEGTRFESLASGIAIRVAGFDQGGSWNLSSFENSAGASVFQTPNGNWMIYARTDDPYSFSPGGLMYDFKQYNFRYGLSQELGVGNGFLFEQAPGLELASGSFSKVYDGTADAGTSAGRAFLGLLAGDQVTGSFAFESPNAGLAQRVTLGNALDPGVRDANGKPVWGYILGDSFVGDITPRPLTLGGVTAADKVYDGTRTASVSGGTLSGLVAGETLGIALGGALFDTANVGTDKAVTGTVTLVDGTGLASNYVLADGTFATTADITPRPLTLGGVTAADKVYDGTRTASVSGGTLGGLVSGETLGIALGGALFDTVNVGTGKTVSGTATLVDGTGLASNYVLADGTFATTADITPRPLTLGGVTAADKVYDGTRTASVSGGTLGGLVAGETLGIALGGALFDTVNVGTGKTVSGTATLVDGTGLASNYVLADGKFATTADITPATLTYVANPVNGVVGQATPPLSGTVTGFVGGDTLASATTGSLLFSTSATPDSEVGVYPIFGSGLVATNYVFAQAASNATAYVQQASAADSSGPAAKTDQYLDEIRVAVSPPMVTTSSTDGRVLNSFTGLRGIDLQGGTRSFESIALSELTQGEVTALLAARSEYKRTLLDEAIRQLQADPTRADAPPCETVEQALAGTCLVTEALRSRIRGEGAPVVAAPAAPPIAASAATAPTAEPTAPAQTTPPGASGAPPSAEAVASAPPRQTLEPLLPARRPVRSAALPQIQRKVAVVIGVERYEDSRIPELPNATKDARSVARTLEQSAGYETVILENPTRAQILGTLNRLALDLGPQDSLMVYYGGHGEVVTSTGRGYWQAADASASDAGTWISNDDIGRVMAIVAARQVAVVANSCFAGAFVGDERIRGIRDNVDPQELLQRRAAVVMTAGGNEPVFDAGRNGYSPFAWNLMREIEATPAWRPGSNVFERVRFKVASEVPQRPQYGALRAGGHEPGADYVFEQRQLGGGG